MNLKKLGTGRTAEVFLTEDGKALKLYYDWYPKAAMEAEKCNAELLEGLNVPAPKFYGKVEYEGKDGLLYDAMQGQSLMPRFITGEKQAILELALLHRQILANRCEEAEDIKKRLSGLIKAADLPECIKAKALEKLTNLPDGENLLHMDFHPDNVMQSENGLFVIDWNNMAKGAPLFDIARTAMLLEYSMPPEEVRALFDPEIRKAATDIYLEAMGTTREEIADYFYVIFASRAGECTFERDMLMNLLEER